MDNPASKEDIKKTEKRLKDEIEELEDRISFIEEEIKENIYDKNEIAQNIYLTIGTPPNYEVTIPDFKVGKIYLIEFHANTTGAASNIKVNNGINKPIYVYGTSIAGDSTIIRAGLVAFIIFYETYCRFVSHTEAAAFAHRATYSSYGVYGGFTNLTTMNTMQNKYIRIGYVNLSFNSTYVEKQGGNISVELVEQLRSRDISIPFHKRERFTVNVKWDLPAISNGVIFQSTIPDIQVEVDGEMYDTKPEDIIMAVLSNTSSAKYIYLYIKSNVPDKIFQINPVNKFGGNFSPTATNAGIYWATAIEAAIPSLPIPAQGDYIHAIYSRSVSREVILFKGFIEKLTLYKSQLMQFDNLQILLAEFDYWSETPITSVEINTDKLLELLEAIYAHGVSNHFMYKPYGSLSIGTAKLWLIKYEDDRVEIYIDHENEYFASIVQFDRITGQPSISEYINKLRITEIIGKRRALV